MTLSPRAAVVLCWFGLALFLWCGYHQTRVGAVSDDALPASYPARVGERVVSGPEEARFWIGTHAPGSNVRVEQAGVVRQVPVVRASSPLRILLTVLPGLAFWLACLLAFARRVETEPARSFYWGSFLYGLAILAGGVDAATAPWFPSLVRPLLRIVTLALAPAMFVRIAYVFPRRSPAYDRLRVGRWLFAAAALMAFAGVGAYLGAVTSPGAASFARWAGAERAGQAYVFALVVIGMVQLARNTRTAELERERQQAKWIWWGVVFGALPFALFHALPRALGKPPLVPIELVRPLSVVVPVSFGIAVARHRFMDIDVIIRRSLIYGAIAAVLTLVYLSAGVVLGRLFGPRTGPTSELLGLASATLAVALFTPTRDLVQRAVDQTFFRLRTDLGRALVEFQAELASVVDAGELARRIERFVRETLAPRAAGVVLGSGAATATAGTLTAVVAAATADAAPRALHDATSRPEIEAAGLPAALAAAGVVLVQPVPAAGAILLGEKASERRYVDEELDFLAGVARETARTFERVELARRAAEEAFLRARQLELDRMKSRFLSQVAHDLRTPLTSILWSSQNLLDGVFGPLPDGATENARAIGAAAGHLGGLVTNLLEIAQLEDGRLAPALEPVDARAVIAQAVLALGPLAARRGVVLDVSDGSVPPVSASRDGLTKIVLNLLDNALKFSPARGRVTIAIDRDPDGWQRIVVCDEGPGVPEDERERIFGSYERGSAAVAAAGGAAGFGLGLSVVRAYAERFGGRAEVGAAPGGRGARFTCRLREWSNPEA
jgi:signal transduction histidine kinase